MKIKNNQNYIICGDNVEWLVSIPDESVDVCYIDPPFFSNRNYEVIWGNGFETRSFGDRFAGGISHYIEWMRPRIELIHRKLKATGAIFLHCDCNASHRLRSLLDDVFGEANFRNFITWKRCDTHNDAKKQFSVISDHILFYTKTDAFKFQVQHGSHAEKTLREWYLFLDLPDGTTRKMTKEEIASQKIPRGARRYNTGDLSSPNPRPNLMYNYKGYPHPKNGWRVDIDRMKELDKDGKLLFPKEIDGRIMQKRYLDEQDGPVVGDIWTDIEFLRGNDKEVMGYKTQKPIVLIKRMIACSCPEDGVVLDCFAGSGSTGIAASELGRRFIIGDVSPVAIKIAVERFLFDAPNVKYELKNLPQSEDELKEMNGHDFAEVVCEVMGWDVNDKKSGDGGIDGWTGEGAPVQVKNHAKSAAGRPDMQKFFGALAKEKAKKGYFIAWDFSKDAIGFVADMKREHKIEIIPMKCAEVFGALLLDGAGTSEIEKFYQERRPESWNKRAQSNGSAESHKAPIALGKRIKQKTGKGRAKDVSGQ